MERYIFSYEQHKAYLSIELIGEYEYVSKGGDYKLRVYKDNFFMLTLSGKYFMADYQFLFDDIPNHCLSQYEDGKTLKWIRLW